MKIKIVTIVALALYLCGCKKEEKQSEYGCDSPVLSTVRDVPGVLYYNKANNNISLVTQAGSIFGFYQVCNPEYEQFEQLNYKTQDSIPVLFDGQLKASAPQMSPAVYTYYTITILSISKR
ncbi:hypothetical protein QNI19_19585 [Cytophagaceae bacterium DM2B3-1]|uniref:Uncharacterized protein n=1 Tax=Xanthocytophaga flava TaxID=3048013 RepID=A0ABT7CN37_9BACT|nr:hypothetical protein [Xanthocytophaga flavus]MDJ1495151.1 hypothetical protein [Xanthocytophaga flavus]